MSTPGQGDGRYRPGAPNAGGPGSYGGPGEPTKYPQGQQSPYGQQSSPYAYSPYGSPYQPPPEEKPVTRPGILWLALTLMMLSTLPFLLIGVALLVVPEGNPALQLVLSALDSVDPNNQLPADQRLLVVRIVGGVFTGLAALYVLFALMSFAGRNWARIVATLMTGGFTVIWIINLVGGVGTMEAASLLLVVFVLVASIGGTIVLYLPGPSEFFIARRSR